jgi:DHA3 family macrolide efflux protein-like MFS transporter
MKKSILFLVCKWIITFGNRMQMVVLPVIVFSIWQSTELLSLTFIVETIPWLMISPFLTVLIKKYFTAKKAYIIGNLLRAICIISLTFFIKNYIMIIVIFFILGIINSCISPIYATLIRKNTSEDNLNYILSISLGVDDVISIIAPILVTIGLGMKMNPIIFIYLNALLMFGAACLGLAFPSHKEIKVDKIIVEERLIVLLNKFRQNIMKVIRNGKFSYIIVIESIRSFAEGMCIPILISYVLLVLKSQESIYTTGEIVNSIAQVILSLFYIIMIKKISQRATISIGTIFMGISLLLLCVTSTQISYMFSMFLLGGGMALRQIVAENILISNASETEVAHSVTIFNATISFSYIAGYGISIFLQNKPLIICGFFAGFILLILSVFKKDK